MPIETYTVTSASFEAESGDNISGGANPTVTLVISPIEGYTVSSGDFSIGNALPSEVASAVFSQDGNNVNCLVTFATGFVMPSADVELLIDIDGSANQQGFTIDGEYTISQTNVQESATTPVAFSQTAVEGTEVTLFTKTFTASSGYYFAALPYYYQTLGANRNESNYIISVSYIGVGSTPENYITTSVTYTVKYIVGTSDETLNDFNFVADAIQQYTPLSEVTAYSILASKFPPAGTTRQISFYGGAGTEVTFTTTHPYPVDSYVSNNNTQTLTLDEKGVATMTIIVPENTTGSNQTWTFTLSGSDLASPFAQTNPFTIIQLL
jgi:hypothetical protein